MTKHEFDFSAWNLLFEERLRQSRRAQISWARLVEKGCDPKLLARNAAYACDFDGAPGNAHLFAEAVGEWEWQRQRAERAARQLDATCKDAAELLCDPNKLLLAEACSKAAAELKGDAARIEELISVGEMDPTVFLVEIVEHVRKRTGKPRYREVCDVLYAAYSAHGKDDIVAPGEEALRKTVDRFKQRHPEMTPAAEEHGFWAALVVILIWIIARFSSTMKDSSAANSSRSPDSLASPQSVATGFKAPDTEQQVSNSGDSPRLPNQNAKSEGATISLSPDKRRQSDQSCFVRTKTPEK